MEDIAYGRDVQAEEILKEAMAKDPERTEILMKLLEIYAQRKNRTEYAAHAQQLLARVGADAPLWSAAMAMGFEIDPENPLYHAAGADFLPSPVSAPAERAGLDHDLGESAHDAAIRASIESIGMPESEVSAAPAGSVPQVGSAHTIDFDLGMDDTHAPAAPHPVTPPAATLATVAVASVAAAAAAAAVAEAAAPATPEPVIQASESVTEAPEPVTQKPEPVTQAPEPVSSWPALGTAETAGRAFTPVAVSTLPSNDDDAFTLDFDLGDAPAAPGAAASREGGNAALDLGAIDLNLQRDPPSAAPPVLTLVPPSTLPVLDALPGEARVAAKGFAGIDLDLGEDLAPLETTAPPEERSSEWHNVATKLDLARAYLEIGDREGAGEILREVLHEGDAEQRAEAAQLVSDI